MLTRPRGALLVTAILVLIAGVGMTAPHHRVSVVQADTVIVGTDVPATQGLRSSVGARLETYDVTKSIDMVGDIPGTLIKIHNFDTTLGRSTMYVKQDGGGGYIQFQRDPGNLIIGGIGGNGAWRGAADDRDDMAIEATRTIRFYANGAVSAGMLVDSTGVVVGAGKDLRWGKPTVLPGTSAPATLGKVGGTGRPATAVMNGWLSLKDATGATVWVPVWK
jgi:hypothetical protein